LTAPGTTPEYGYQFKEWSPSVPSVFPSTDATYTATWEVKPAELYFVVYIGNGNTGGTAPVDSTLYPAGSVVNVLGHGSLVKDGYVFLGWSDNQYATTASFTAGSTFFIYDDVELFAVWSKDVAVVYTVTYEPGLHGTFAAQITTGLSYGDPTPTAPIVTGEVGWEFIGWSPKPSETVTKNVTYTAQWEQKMLTVRFVDWDNKLLKEERVAYGGSATAPPNPTRAGYTFIGWDRPFNNVVLDLTVTAQYKQNDSGTTTPTPPPVTTPPPTSPPPTSPPPTSPPTEPPIEPKESWALINLVLSIIGIILAIIVLVAYILLPRKQKQKKQQQRQSRLLWLLLTIILGIAGIVLFLLTEDWTLNMVWVDRWSIVNAIIFIMEVIAITLTFKHAKKANKKTETTNEQDKIA